jgi:hypothetical protein
VIEVLLRSVDVLQSLLGADADAAMPADGLEVNARIEALMGSESDAAETDSPLHSAGIDADSRR